MLVSSETEGQFREQAEENSLVPSFHVPSTAAARCAMQEVATFWNAPDTQRSEACRSLTCLTGGGFIRCVFRHLRAFWALWMANHWLGATPRGH